MKKWHEIIEVTKAVNGFIGKLRQVKRGKQLLIEGVAK